MALIERIGLMTYIGFGEKNYKDPCGKPITFGEWYDTHDSAKPFRDRVMKALNQLRFKSGIWKPVMDMGFHDALIQDWDGTAFDHFKVFVNDVRKLAGMPPMNTEEVRDGLKYRNPFATINYDWAIKEMWLLCWKDW
jgi:hypothetical protein